MVDYTKRQPDYSDDIQKYGGFGERVFLERYSQKMDIVDVRKNKTYQRRDIDFLVAKEDGVYSSVDVKVDTVGITSKKLVFEVISHSSSGWGLTTKADYIFMILAREEKGELEACVGYWLDVREWREFCAERTNKKVINTVVGEGIVDLLCSIEDLKSQNVIKKEIFF